MTSSKVSYKVGGGGNVRLFFSTHPSCHFPPLKTGDDSAGLIELALYTDSYL